MRTQEVTCRRQKKKTTMDKKEEHMLVPKPQMHAHNRNSKFLLAICFTLSYIGCMVAVVDDNCLIIFCQHCFYIHILIPAKSIALVASAKAKMRSVVGYFESTTQAMTKLLDFQCTSHQYVQGPALAKEASTKFGNQVVVDLLQHYTLEIFEEGHQESAFSWRH
jgi:hypothetical protein